MWRNVREAQRQRILEITRRRVQSGLDTNVELREASAAVPEAHVELLQAQAAAALDTHQLAALSGQGAEVYAQVRRPTLDPARHPAAAARRCRQICWVTDRTCWRRATESKRPAPARPPPRRRSILTSTWRRSPARAPSDSSNLFQGTSGVVWRGTCDSSAAVRCGPAAS